MTSASSQSSAVKPAQALHRAEDGASGNKACMFNVVTVNPYGENHANKVARVLEDRGNEPLDLSNVYHLAMDWKNDQKQGSYVLVESKDVEYTLLESETTYDCYESDKITLGHCLRLFTEPEVLSPQEAWYCPSCKEHRQATKELSLWRLPVVLIIQLKRFSFTRSIFRDKIDKMVEFPVSGLNVSPFCSGPTSDGRDSPPVYDLFAVINHHGGMLGGHYTAFARCTNLSNTQTSEVGWRVFDDSRVVAMPVGKVVTASAYMLFYRRRGVDFHVPNVAKPSNLGSDVSLASKKLQKDRENLLGKELSAQQAIDNNLYDCCSPVPRDVLVDILSNLRAASVDEDEIDGVD